MNWFSITSEVVFSGVLIAVLVSGLLENSKSYHAWNDTVRVVKSSSFKWVAYVATFFAVMHCIFYAISSGSASVPEEAVTPNVDAISDGFDGFLTIALGGLLTLLMALKLYFVKYFGVKAFSAMVNIQPHFNGDGPLVLKLKDYTQVFVEASIPIMVVFLVLFSFSDRDITIGLMTLSSIVWLAFISAAIRHSQGDRPKAKVESKAGEFATQL